MESNHPVTEGGETNDLQCLGTAPRAQPVLLGSALVILLNLRRLVMHLF